MDPKEVWKFKFRINLKKWGEPTSRPESLDEAREIATYLTGNTLNLRTPRYIQITIDDIEEDISEDQTIEEYAVEIKRKDMKNGDFYNPELRKRYACDCEPSLWYRRAYGDPTVHKSVFPEKGGLKSAPKLTKIQSST